MPIKSLTKSEIETTVRQDKARRDGQPLKRFIELKSLPRREALQLIAKIAKRAYDHGNGLTEAINVESELKLGREYIQRAAAAAIKSSHEFSGILSSIQRSIYSRKVLDKRIAKLQSRQTYFAERLRGLSNSTPSVSTISSQFNRFVNSIKGEIGTMSVRDIVDDLIGILAQTQSLLYDVEQDMIYVLTEKCVLNSVGTYDDEDHQKKMHDINGPGIDYEVGPYYVCFSMNPRRSVFGGTADPVGVALYIENPEEQRQYWGHPHVSNGQVCYGEMGVVVKQASTKLRIQYVMDILFALMRGYSPGECFGGCGLPNTAEEPHVFKSDRGYDIGNIRSSQRNDRGDWEDEEGGGEYECDDCGGSMWEDDSYRCDHCEAVLCGDCSRSCDDCGSTRCSNCCRHCDLCDQEGNYTNLCCRSGGTMRCGMRCEDCGNVTCPHHTSDIHPSACTACADEREDEDEDTDNDEDSTESVTNDRPTRRHWNESGRLEIWAGADSF
jgi:hypothetical protein